MQYKKRVDFKIYYKLYVSSFSPKIGSIRGNTVVHIHGSGFRFLFFK